MQDTTQSSDQFKVLTERGEQYVKDSIDDMRLPSVDIDKLLTNDNLRERVRDDYISEDYETTVFKAFKLLEEKVRSISGQEPEVIGASLMSRVFNPTNCLISHPDVETAAEKEGLHHLMRGAIMWFKNPTSHRTVGYHDPESVAHVLSFANLLLDLVDQCQRN